MATALKWPLEIWPLLLQSKIQGKALEVVSTLSPEDSLDFSKVKATILHAYELVPEDYRQKFRGHCKSATQTCVEFARDKETLFDRWCAARGVDDFTSLRELILMEEFKKSLPERMLIHFNEQRISSLLAAAVMADEYVLIHKVVFPAAAPSDRLRVAAVTPPSTGQAALVHKKERVCFYC